MAATVSVAWCGLDVPHRPTTPDSSPRQEDLAIFLLQKPARLELERDESCIATQPSIFLIDKKARLVTAAQCSCVACGPRYCQVIREANREARLLWCQQMLLDGETFDDEVFTDETIINLDTHEDIGDYDLLIGIAKGRFPTSSIVMSSVLPRLDFNDRRIVLNQHLAEVCDDRDVVYYKNFETINPAMLARDHLHLHKEGVFGKELPDWLHANPERGIKKKDFAMELLGSLIRSPYSLAVWVPPLLLALLQCTIRSMDRPSPQQRMVSLYRPTVPTGEAKVIYCVRATFPAASLWIRIRRRKCVFLPLPGPLTIFRFIRFFDLTRGPRDNGCDDVTLEISEVETEMDEFNIFSWCRAHLKLYHY
ncbi:hypothetical protein Bbelb_421230 [Branchiostoma belcheri]|nr:hypothetical protein Bbelb_421230 [Branchiostoma belcheri]